MSTSFLLASLRPGHFLRLIRLSLWLQCLGLFCSLALFTPGLAADLNPGYGVSLEWDPNPEPEVAGYRLYYGMATRTYTQTFDAGNVVEASVLVIPGIPYFFAVSAYDAQGFESDYSNEVTYTAPTLLVERFTPLEDSLPMDGTPTLAQTVLRSDGSLSFVILSKAGRPLQVEASSDLQAWICLGLLDNPTGGLIVTDGDAPRHRRRYYRLVEPPVVE